MEAKLKKEEEQKQRDEAAEQKTETEEKRTSTRKRNRGGNFFVDQCDDLFRKMTYSYSFLANCRECIGREVCFSRNFHEWESC